MKESKPSLFYTAAAVTCVLLFTTGCSILGGSTNAVSVPPAEPPTSTVETPEPIPSTATPTTPPAPTWDQTFAEAKTGVARISVTGCEFAAVGSGFLVDEFHVATAAHVVEGAAGITVGVNGQVVTATVVGTNSDEDVALLRTDFPVDGHHFSFTAKDAVEGTEVGVLGYPQGESFVTDQGTIAGVDVQNGPVFNGVGHILQTSVAINGGNSGGPLIGLDGAVAGIVRAVRTGVLNNGEVYKQSFEGTNYVSSGAFAGKLVRGWQQTPEDIPLDQCNGAAIPTDNRIAVTVDTPDIRATQVAQSLLIHAQAINGGAYSMAYNVFTPQAQIDQKGWEFWSRNMDSSYWESITVGDVRSTGAGTITADASIRTVQDPEVSDSGTQSCSVWHLRYTLVWASVWWEISAVKETMPTKSC